VNTHQLRLLKYRLKSQGMCELDAWLAPLENALMRNTDIASYVSQLLQHEAPELQAMMYGQKSIPAALKPWLSKLPTHREKHEEKNTF